MKRKKNANAKLKCHMSDPNFEERERENLRDMLYLTQSSTQ